MSAHGHRKRYCRTTGDSVILFILGFVIGRLSFAVWGWWGFALGFALALGAVLTGFIVDAVLGESRVETRP